MDYIAFVDWRQVSHVGLAEFWTHQTGWIGGCHAAVHLAHSEAPENAILLSYANVNHHQACTVIQGTQLIQKLLGHDTGVTREAA